MNPFNDIQNVIANLGKSIHKQYNNKCMHDGKGKYFTVKFFIFEKYFYRCCEIIELKNYADLNSEIRRIR